MSNPRFYWYGIARKMVQQYPRIKSQAASKQEEAYRDAIERVVEATKAMPEGEKRVRAVKEILWDKTKTYEGVAQELHYDWRTVQNWINRFINAVGKEAGF